MFARVETKRVNRAVARESRKGYGLLFVCVEKMRNPDGSFSANVESAAAVFDGPMALTIAGCVTEFVAAEQATYLFRSMPRNPHAAAWRSPSRFRAPARRDHSRKRNERALMQDVAAVAKRYDHDNIRIALDTKETRDAAILKEAQRAAADMIAIGAARRTGDSRYLGQTVANVLEQWKGAIVPLAS